MNDSDMFIGLDIGTTSVKVVVAESYNGQVNILGYGNAYSSGLSRGIIVDIDKVVETIKNAVKQAEEKANVNINTVTVGVPANMLQIEKCQGMIVLDGENGTEREITDEDVQRVTEAAMVQTLPPERDVVDIVPDQFVVDSLDYIKDPRGMDGVRLEMRGIMYTGPKTILHNIRKSVRKAGLKIRDIVVAPLALSKYALNDGEQDFGSVLIDLGGGQTSAAVIHDHQLKYTFVDQEGGEFVTRDISIVLNTSMQNAERLKREFGFALSSMASPDETIPVDVVGKQEQQFITEEYLAEIIEARLRQIFEKVKRALDNINALQLPGGVVITGGMASMRGVEELAREIFGVNVQLFVPSEVSLRTPAFSQVISLVEYSNSLSEISVVVKRTLNNSDMSYVPRVDEQSIDNLSSVDVDADIKLKKPKLSKKNKPADNTQSGEKKKRNILGWLNKLFDES